MDTEDLRWVQRLEHFAKALAQLEDAEVLAQQRQLSKLEEQGFIRAFEFTHELAWKTLKDFLESRGVQGLYGSKDVIRRAFKAGLINNGEIWMDMIQSRNFTSHTYDKATTARSLSAVRRAYIAEFEELRTKMEDLREEPERGEPM